MIGVALVVAAATLFGGITLAFMLRLLPTVRTQLVGLALLAVILPLAIVLLSGWVMFHMGADVKILAVSTASASAAVVAALLLVRSVSRRLERLRSAAATLAAGDLSARAPEEGPVELRELARSFNEMAASLGRLFDSRRELVAWASHDLRTPIASMQAMLEALDDELAEPKDYLPALLEQSRTLAMLVDDLFELARIDAGALTLELHEAELSGLIESCFRALGPQAEAGRVHLETRGSGAAICAPEKVERVLYNLVTNSLRHTPTDGAVAVMVEPNGTEILVAVEDTGEGLDEGTQERMFERFWRRDAARPRGGAGLGLAIARGLVEAQGGRMWAENRAGGGARIAFTLPAASL